MKLVSLFADFLRDTVNLNQTRIDTLETSVDALKTFLREADWGGSIRTFEEQGSWAHDTIIKPVDGGEFDADLLVMVNPVKGWSAADYVQKLGAAFAGSKTYEDKAKTWEYCVTITYAAEHKVDIAPCVVDRRYTGSLEVCNRPKNAFEQSEPVAYTDWLKEQNGYSGSNSFRKVTRLLKYLRDIKTTFTCPSVLLTTLLGQEISWLDKDSDAFADTPTTLRTLMGRLDDRLQQHSTKPKVLNPKLTSEDFADLWTDEQYTNFRAFIHKYRGWVDEAYSQEGRAESIKAWRRIFGDAFAKGESVSVAKSIAEGTAYVQRLLVSTAAHLPELVDAIRDFGIRILPFDFNRPPHLQPPPWKPAGLISNDIAVTAVWQSSRYANQSRPLRSGEILDRRGGIWFDAHGGTGTPIPPGYRVQWRITNTGAMAMALKAGRGGFYPPMVDNRRWEELEYRGVHIAEAFVIRLMDDALIAQSPPFHVVIQ